MVKANTQLTQATFRVFLTPQQLPAHTSAITHVKGHAAASPARPMHFAKPSATARNVVTRKIVLSEKRRRADDSSGCGGWTDSMIKHPAALAESRKKEVAVGKDRFHFFGVP
jgi:hypothetical protein